MACADVVKARASTAMAINLIIGFLHASGDNTLKELDA
jgi:hypothetical protein